MLRDYQRVLVDNIIEDLMQASSWDAVRIRLESRIEAYDRELADNAERDLPNIIACAVSEYLR